MITERDTAMLNVDTATRRELEDAIVCGDDTLYAMFDEGKLLNGDYTTEEMREIFQRWIMAGDECGGC